jgi:hypothetical protein
MLDETLLEVLGQLELALLLVSDEMPTLITERITETQPEVVF